MPRDQAPGTHIEPFTNYRALTLPVKREIEIFYIHGGEEIDHANTQ